MMTRMKMKTGMLMSSLLKLRLKYAGAQRIISRIVEGRKLEVMIVEK